MDVLLDAWCRRPEGEHHGKVGKGGGRGGKDGGATRTAPYYKPEGGEAVFVKDCGPIPAESIMEAKEILYAAHPQVKQFVEDMDICADTSASERLDMQGYLAAVLQAKDNVDTLQPVHEFMEQRKRARVAEAAS